MTISRTTRKILWAKSGGRCAICRRQLVIGANEIGRPQDSVIGEECHIVGRKVNSPRGKSSMSLPERDELPNLILLCRNDHKVIDDREDVFTVAVLHEIKISHELWVEDRLSQGSKVHRKIIFASRIDTGVQLWNSVIECDALTFDNVQPESPVEATLLAEFADRISDYADFRNDISIGDRVKAQFELDGFLSELAQNGLLVYAKPQRKRLTSKSNQKQSVEMIISYLLVVRMSNPIVHKKDDEIETVMSVPGQKSSVFTCFVPIFTLANSVRFT